MHQPTERTEQELPARAERNEASQEAERRIQQAADAPSYQQNGDGSYQRHFSDRQGRDVTLRVEGNDAQSLARAAGDQRLHSQHSIAPWTRLRPSLPQPFTARARWAGPT